MKVKNISNIMKVISVLLLLSANIIYFIMKHEFVSINQQMSIIFAVFTIFAIFLPVDASIVLNNINKIKSEIKE